MKYAALMLACLIGTAFMAPAHAQSDLFKGLIQKGVEEMQRAQERDRRRLERGTSRPQTDAGDKSLSQASDQDERDTLERQAVLRAAGYDVGAVDGIWGPKARIAAKAFQARLGRPQTGWLTSEELTLLRMQNARQRLPDLHTFRFSPQAPFDLLDDDQRTRQMQAALSSAGYDIGAIDGVWGARAREAARSFQARHNRPQTGRLSAEDYALLSAQPQTITAEPPRTAPSATTATASIVTGEWQGRYFCRDADPVGELRITIHEQGGELRARERYKRGTREGTIEYLVSPDSGTGRMRFSIQQQSNARLRPYEILYAPQGSDRLTGQYLNHPNCSHSELTRSGSVPMTADRPSGPIPPVAGRWRGQLACSGSADVQVFLRVQPDGANRFRATFEYFPKNHLSGGSGALEMVAEYEAPSQAFRFAIDRNARTFGGLNLTGFLLSVADGGVSSSATSISGSCSRMALIPDDAWQDRSTPTRQASGPGAYYSQSQCQALVDWTGRLGREFPSGVSASDMYSRFSLLFGDDDFVNVFGMPFDRMDDSRKSHLYMRAFSECSRDPLFANRMQGVREVFRGFSPTRLTSFGGPSISFVIGQQREIQHALRRLDPAASSVAPSDWTAAEQRIAAFTRLLDVNASALWPSDMQSYKARLEVIASDAAQKAADTEIAGLQALPDALEKIRGFTRILKQEPTWSAKLSSQTRSRIEAELSAQRDDLIKAMLAPVYARLAEQPRTLAGVAAARALLDEHTVTIEALGPPIRQQIASQVEEWRQGVVQELVKTRTEALAAFPAGADGLAKNAEWLQSFEQYFATVADMPSVALARQAHSQDRLRRLRQGVSEFDAVLSEKARQGLLDSGVIEQELLRFLCIPSDWKHPTALEYKLVAADYRRN